MKWYKQYLLKLAFVIISKTMSKDQDNFFLTYQFVKIWWVFLCWVCWKIKLSWGNCQGRLSKWKTKECQLVQKNTKSLDIKLNKKLIFYCMEYTSIHRCPNADMNCNLHTQISNFVVSLWSLYKSTISGDLK